MSSPVSRLAKSKEQYKVTSTVAQADRRRSKFVDARKDKKEQHAAKRRRADDDEEEVAPAHGITAASVAGAVKAAATNGPSAARLAALRQLRRFLSTTDDAGVQAAIEGGAITLLAYLVASKVGTPASPAGVIAGSAAAAGLAAAPSTAGAAIAAVGDVTDEERLEAVWCCSNIAAGAHEHTLPVLHAVSPFLIALLGSPNALLADHAAWALGNCAADGQEARDILAAQGAIKPLVDLLAARNKSLAATAAWALANMLKGTGPCTRARPFLEAGIVPAALHWLGLAATLSLAAVAASAAAAAGSGAAAAGGAASAAGAAAAAAAAAAAVVPGSDHEASLIRTADLVTEVVWLLALLADKEPAARDALGAAGIVPLVSQALMHGQLRGVSPCLRVLGLMTAHGDSFVDALLDNSRCPGLLAALAIIAAPSALAAGAGAGGSPASSPRGSPLASPALGSAASSARGSFAGFSALRVGYDADHTAGPATHASAAGSGSGFVGFSAGAGAGAGAAGSASGLALDADGHGPDSHGPDGSLSGNSSISSLGGAFGPLGPGGAPSGSSAGRSRSGSAAAAAASGLSRARSGSSGAGSPLVGSFGSGAAAGGAAASASAASAGAAAAAFESNPLLSISRLPSAVTFTAGHIREVLWVLSNVAGGRPQQAVALLSATLPPHIAAAAAAAAQPCTGEQAALGFLPLFVAHASGPWTVRKAATWCLFNIANQRFAAAPSEGGGPGAHGTFPGGNMQHPLLGAVLSYPAAVALLIKQLEVPDIEQVRLGLAFADLCLYNWRRPARVAGPSPFAAVAVQPQPGGPAGEDLFSLPAGGGIGTAGAARGSIANPLPLPASVLRLGPHTLAAAAAASAVASRPLAASASTAEASRLASAHASSLLDEQHRLIALLEYARDTHAGGDVGPDGAGAESGDSATGDDDSLLSSAAAAGLVLRRQVTRWAGHLLDAFYGEDADELDGYGDGHEDGHVGLAGLAGFAFAAHSALPAAGAAGGPPAVAGGHFVFGGAAGAGSGPATGGAAGGPFAGAAAPSAFAAPAAAGWGPLAAAPAPAAAAASAAAPAPVAGPVRGQVMLPAWMTRAQQAAPSGP